MEIFKGVLAQREMSMKAQERYPKNVSYRWHNTNVFVPRGTLYANDMYILTSEILVGNKRHAQNRDGNHTSWDRKVKDHSRNTLQLVHPEQLFSA